MGTVSVDIIIIVCFIFLIALGILVYILLGKADKNKQMLGSLDKLKRSFNELDEQAKLIVKTDLELNKAQEELDKRLRDLEALQTVSKLISTTLDEEEIYERLDNSIKEQFSFNKYLTITYDKNRMPHARLTHGFDVQKVQTIISQIENDTSLYEALKDGHIFSSINTPTQRREAIVRIFDVEHFVISPILTQNGMIGVIFVSYQSATSTVTEGDEELVSILANQIGQSLENARLFEEVFRSSKSLETKVQDRTKQLATALDDVKTISKTKSEFISAVSHELRTPLTSIKGYASLLMSGKLGEIPNKVKERLNKINTHSDNLVKLINDLLDISRIESGKAEMNIGKCNLKLMVDNVEDLLTPQMKEKNITFESDIDKKIPIMMLDSSQVERIFINLVSNAIKFTPEKGNISISAQLKTDDPRQSKVDASKQMFSLDDPTVNKQSINITQSIQVVEVRITDTGIGISEEDLKRLFDEFFRVENQVNQNVKGTGLGLSLAKKIVEAHSGRMWVTSKVGEGTTFHFTLPLEQKT